MSRTRYALTGALFALAVNAWPQGPTIHNVNPTETTRSGRIVITGAGFGTHGKVTVDGVLAIVTQWHADEVHAYIPESVDIGEANVRVRSSKAFEIEIAERATSGNGRILWRFQTDRWMNTQFIGVGPDRRVYISDQLGLYALTPNGALIWFAPGSGGGHPIDFLSNGVIVTGRGDSQGPELIKALNRDGSIRWEFVPPISWDLLNGPNVGPDGNIYGAQDFTIEGGLGFLSLNPEGQLRWSNIGNPEIFTALSESNSEVVFGPKRSYSAIVRPRSGGNPVTYAFDFDGNQIFETGTGGIHQPLFTFPNTDPRGNVIGSWGQTGVLSLSPDGDVNFIRLHPGHPNFIRRPDTDSASNIYAADFLGIELWSLTPDGDTRWVLPREDNTAVSTLGVSPDNSRIVVLGSSDGAGWVRGYLPANGQLLWEVNFQPEGGWNQYTNNIEPVFAALVSAIPTSSRTPRVAYVSTHFAHVQEVPYGYIYAIRID
jgi:hypothetical protein